MDFKREAKPLFWMAALFAAAFWLPVGHARFDGAVTEAFHLVRWYAREHVLLCLVPAFFIAGAICVFLDRGAVMRHLGAQANQVVAYAVASVSGTILAVCSCTVLPLFAGIHRRGAGLGPATAFLYSGPAINVLAIVLTARVLGPRLGLARGVMAVVLSVVLGVAMQLLFRREARAALSAGVDTAALAAPFEHPRPLRHTALWLASMVAVLVFANWGAAGAASGWWAAVGRAKWMVVAVAAAGMAVMLVRWYAVAWPRAASAGLPAAALGVALPHQPQAAFVAGLLGLSWLTARDRGELGEWFRQTWDFAKQIVPLLLLGVLLAGLLLGRPGHEGLIPSEWVALAVGGNSLRANLLAAVAGAFMYFATLTEVPILQGLMGGGMGEGPALALLLAGPALSLPSMLVLRRLLGTRKTVVYVALVILLSTIAGLVHGALFAER